MAVGRGHDDLDLGRFLSLDYFKSQQLTIEAWRAAQPFEAALLFFATYVAVTGLSLPGATVMTLVAGAVFGLFWGFLLVSFASSLMMFSLCRSGTGCLIWRKGPPRTLCPASPEARSTPEK